MKRFSKLADAIRFLRGKQSQALFATTYAVSRQAVAQWESGQTSPKPEILEKMGIDSEYILK